MLLLLLSYLSVTGLVTLVSADYRRASCGQRLSGIRTLNVTVKSQFSVDLFGSDYETFPWLVPVYLRSDEDDDEAMLLCSGVAISSYVALAPAHCVVGVPKAGIRIREFEVESLIAHPDYVDGHVSHQHDLAVIKAREISGSTGFEMYACLPDAGDDPVDTCQVADYFQNDTTIVGHDVEFGPSVICAEETPHLRGYLDSPTNILCAEEACSRFIQGPVFCQKSETVDKGKEAGYNVAGLSTSATNWCSVGAYTRLAKYSDWIAKTIEYLEGVPTQDRHRETPRNGFDDDNDSIKLDDDRPCSKKPCGPRAVCWNSGDKFLCTCSDHDFPKGNPYQGCFKCLYDQHCNPNLAEEPYQCVNNTCLLSEQMEAKIPPEYVKLGSEGHYFVSQEQLSWPQAQYECQSRSGLLAEVTGSGSTFSRAVLKLLGIDSKNSSDAKFWVGASDLGNRGNFVWYNADKTVSDNNWADRGRPEAMNEDKVDKDQRCLQVGQNGQWFAHSCEAKSTYVCKHDPHSYSLDVSNPLDDGTARDDRQRTFFDTLSPKSHYKDVCGRRFVRTRGSRIVGGGVANYGEWPWQVSLKQYKNGQFRHKCGAALLTHQYVITAAHCVKDVAPSNLIVRIGEYNVLDLSETHRHVDKRIKLLIVHSSFDKDSYEYDIALLKMSSEVPFQPNIIPICLPSTKSLLVGKTGSVTGWGRRSEYGSISPVLREVHLPIISNKRCMEMYRASGQNEWIPQIFVCAGTTNGGKDSCEGDSGGPLVIKGRNGRYELAGVISWGIGCGDRNRPGVYTRISEFKSWILRNSNYKL